MTYAVAPTKYIDVNGVRFAYRELGPKGNIPLVMLPHFTAVMDEWDPAIVDGMAAQRHVIVFDNRGLGNSGGVTPATVKEMAADASSFISALGLKSVDVLGFSLGGYVAQQLAIDHGDQVRKLILTGTGPSGIALSDIGYAKVAQQVANWRAKAVEMDKHAKHYLFFPDSDEGQIAANQFLTRLGQRIVDKVKPVTEASVAAHVSAIQGWAQMEPDGLLKLTQETLIANGDGDVMVPTQRSFELHRLIKNSTLSIFPHAGHGGIFQYHEIFVPQALKFLNRTA